MIVVAIILSLLWHAFIIFILSFSSNPIFQKTEKLSTKARVLRLGSNKYKKVEVTLGTLPTIAKKDIKYLNQVQEASTSKKDSIIYSKKKNSIIKSLEKSIEKPKNKRPKYFDKLKEIKAITSQLKKDLKKTINSSNTSTNIGAKNPYLESIKQIIKVNWKLPMWLKEKNLKAIVSFQIEKNGDISNIEIYQSSKNRDFDKIVLKAIELASPLPTPPLSLLNTKIFVSFP